MFQDSIKKFTKRLVSVFLAALLLSALFVGCTNTQTDKEKEEEKKEEDPLKVSGGELTKGGGGKNDTVMADNLDDFINVFLPALNSDYSDEYSQSGNAPRGKRALPDEYHKYISSEKESRKILGDSSGCVEITKEESDRADLTSYYESESGTYKFFDFSNTNKLFLGGAVGYVDNWEGKNKIDYDTIKYNGTINFQGAYKGKVVFENVVYVSEYTYDDNGDRVYTKNEKSGKFYVESGGKKFDLPDSLVEDFIYPSSNKGEDFGDYKITVNSPAVPAAPNGALTERTGGKVVSVGNADEFFEAFNTEFKGGYDSKAPRALNEATENFEQLEHGIISGYFLKKEVWKIQWNNSGEYQGGTETMEYNDYSNEGRLYFGGGYGKSGYIKYTSSSRKDTTTINGKVKFNGEFKGELDFQSFKYESKSEWNNNDHNYIDEYKLITGKVMIGSYDATNKYLELVIRQN